MDGQADGADLAVRAGRAVVVPVREDPDARPPVHADGRDAELGGGADQQLLEEPDVVLDVGTVAQPDHGVADQLARPVPCDLAAAVHVHDGGAVRGALGVLGAATGRVDGLVLQEEELAVGAAGDDVRVQGALGVPGGVVVHQVGRQAEHAQGRQGCLGHDVHCSPRARTCGQPP